jgi:VWFA-related protein
MRETFLAAALIVCLITSVLCQQPQATPAPSQQPTPPPATVPEVDDTPDDVVRITTKLVQVDAVVTDKNGKHVTDLKAEDFELTENGKLRTITNFSYVQQAAVPPALAENEQKAPLTAKERAATPPAPMKQLRPDQVQRAIALVVDDLRMSAESTAMTRQALRKYVDQQMQPGDLIAIIRTSAGLGALQQFTNDRDQLSAAIDHVRPIAGSGASAFTSVNMLDRLENQVTESLANEAESTADRRRREGAATAAAQAGMRGVESDRIQSLNEFRDSLYTAGTLGALNFVVRGLRQLPGRKAVVLFSDGISIFSSNSTSGNRNERVLAALRALVDRANRSSVVFYAIDTRGLQPTGFTSADDTTGPQAPSNSGPTGGMTGLGAISPDLAGTQVFGNRSGEMFDGQNGLSYLARETGGLAVFNNNDLNRGIRRALEDIGGYYLIGYRPDDSTFEAARMDRPYNNWNIRVKGRPELKVRSRSGFIAVAEDEAGKKPRSRSEQLMAALLSPFAAGGIDVQATSFFLNDPTIGSSMRSVVLMDANKLTFAQQPDGTLETNLDIIGVTLGENGQVIDQASRIEKIRVSKTMLERFQREGMIYGLNVPVSKPGSYLLRIAVRDSASGRIGSASQFVEVPNVNKEKLTLSSLVIAGNNPDTPTRPKSTSELLKSLLSGRSATAVNATAAPAQEAPTGSASVVAGGEGLIGTEDAGAGPASRRFRTRMFLNFACVIYSPKRAAAKQKPAIVTQVRLYHDGQPVFIGDPVPLDMSQQKDMTRLVVARRLFLGTILTPGDYILHLTVTDTTGGGNPKTATRWLDFRMVP